jgi:hypothetical protein
MEVFGLGLQVECIVMMERPSRTLEVQPVSNNVYYPLPATFLCLLVRRDMNQGAG